MRNLLLVLALFTSMVPAYSMQNIKCVVVLKRLQSMTEKLTSKLQRVSPEEHSRLDDSLVMDFNDFNIYFALTLNAANEQGVTRVSRQLFGIYPEISTPIGSVTGEGVIDKEGIRQFINAAKVIMELKADK